MTRKFLTDQEINLNENDFLKTKVYADNLTKIIRNTEPDKVFTIGLYGSWGSGKSSIIETAKNDFDQSKDKFITYDAWQYSNDSFRRMFLQCISEELKYSELNLRRLFYENETSDIKIKNKLSPLKITLFFISSILIYFFIISFFFEFKFKNNFEIITTLSLLSTISVLLLGFFNQFKTSVAKPYFFAPEQFEEQFIKVIKNSFEVKKSFKSHLKFWKKKQKSEIENESKSKLEKIIIIIDNIDRCSSEIAYQLLTDIKTFLGKQKLNIVFIIPVDDKALLKHLFVKTNNSKYNDKEEFLRKIFNVTLRIKPYNSIDMFAFTKSICAINSYDFKNETINIIGKEYSSNPRRVIQLINNLIVELNNYDTIFAQENETIISCILIIREEYPLYYEKIYKNASLLKSKTIDNLDEKEKEEVYRFLRIAEAEFADTENNILNKILKNSNNRFSGIPIEVIDMIESFDSERLIEYFKKNEIIDEEIYTYLCHKIEEAHDNELKDLSKYFQLAGMINAESTIPKQYLLIIFEKFKSKLASIFHNAINIETLLHLVEFEKNHFNKYNLKQWLLDEVEVATNSTEIYRKERWFEIYNSLIRILTDEETSNRIKDDYEKKYADLISVDELTDDQFKILVTKKFIAVRIYELDTYDITDKKYILIKNIISRFEDKLFVLNTIFSKFISPDISKNYGNIRFEFIIMFNDLIQFSNEVNIVYEGKYLEQNLVELFSEIEVTDKGTSVSNIDFFTFFEKESEKFVLVLELLVNYYFLTGKLEIVKQYISRINKYIPELVREKIVMFITKGENINFYLNEIENTDNHNDENLIKIKKYFLNNLNPESNESYKKSLINIIEGLIIDIEDDEYRDVITKFLIEVVDKEIGFSLIANAINKSFFYTKSYQHLRLFPENLKEKISNQIELISIENYLDEEFLKFAFEQDNENLNNKLIENFTVNTKSLKDFDNLLTKSMNLILSKKESNLSKKLIMEISILRKTIKYNKNSTTPLINRIKENLAILDTVVL